MSFKCFRPMLPWTKEKAGGQEKRPKAEGAPALAHRSSQRCKQNRLAVIDLLRFPPTSGKKRSHFRPYQRLVAMMKEKGEFACLQKLNVKRKKVIRLGRKK